MREVSSEGREGYMWSGNEVCEDRGSYVKMRRVNGKEGAEVREMKLAR